MTAWRRVVGLQSQEEEFRDFQMDTENQRREPYQNADELADRLVRNNEVPPTYDNPPDYDGPPGYYDFSWASMHFHM